jgi:hypothetical protein
MYAVRLVADCRRVLASPGGALWFAVPCTPPRPAIERRP